MKINRTLAAESIQADVTLDTFGLLCPIPIVKTAEHVRGLAHGTILEVISTDPGIEIDLANWCRGHGHEYLGCQIEGKTHRAFLRVHKKEILSEIEKRKNETRTS